jgi:phage gp29-like protein
MGLINTFKNYVGLQATPMAKVTAVPKSPTKNLSNYISPVQLERLRYDIKMWREAISEAEFAFYPHRVKMQRMFIDTILNGHVAALWERRKDLTLLRDFKICDAKGIESEDLTAMFSHENNTWFNDFLSYSLDSIGFGYSLISLGDIIDDQFSELSTVRRWVVSPDRNEVGAYVYAQNGAKFLNDPYKDWHIWIKTPSETGLGTCGYGLFYKVAIYEIYLRNTLGFNGDFVELYSQPYRVGKTTKTDEGERAELEMALQQMGSSGYALLDPMDDIAFLETALGGTGYKGYESLEQRCEKKVSKLILGHADAMDSVPGKLGAGSGEENPVAQSLEDKQTKDGRFVQSIINRDLLPRMRKFGFSIPEDYHFEFKNDSEVEEAREREDASNLATANVALTMKNAGLKMDAKYFTERTKIPSEAIGVSIPIPVPVASKEDQLSERVKNKLTQLYK